MLIARVVVGGWPIAAHAHFPGMFASIDGNISI